MMEMKGLDRGKKEPARKWLVRVRARVWGRTGLSER